MKKYILIGIIVIVILVSGYFIFQQEGIDNHNPRDDRTCITEPGKAIYSGNEKCCGELNSIFGSELSEGRCWCTNKDNNCGGAPICAPCGNGICEREYKEDRCNCPEDCK